ncbi:lysophospholipase L1-like esterase [Natronocella acetinitrilica]|uniref:Lysophospholipase L1-like esterase n=1 Tax=Natronocella acetinitrilica TaxID=414046 RepID=A0AAE3G6U3_9GAMM|nr:SGNH/GDSL hydrolase family protein [Natronocella acetinitrilica]MCP1675463.1 lysophospholipase L1-like esterase [Natronocella acetinitrilica]
MPFIDLFDRPDSSTVGNDWVDNLGNIFSIEAARLRSANTSSTPSGFSQARSHFLFRPAAEQSLDQDYEFVLKATSDDSVNFGVAARHQATDLINTGKEDENSFWLIGFSYAGDTELRCDWWRTVENSSTNVSIDNVTLPSRIDLRIRIRIRGANPTVFTADIFRADNNEFIAQRTREDSAGVQVAGRYAMVVWGVSSTIGNTFVDYVSYAPDLGPVGDPVDDPDPDPEPTVKSVYVLGSSTADGNSVATGESWPELLAAEEEYAVTNFASSGETITYSAPDGYSVLSGWSAVNTTANVTAAIAAGADLIVVNFPSNWANPSGADGTVEQYMDVARAIRDACVAAEVDYRFFETQPRNFNQEARDKLAAGAVAISTEFGPRAVQIYDELADTDGTFKSEYDSGDGVHPNAAGHQFLFDQLLASLESPPRIKTLRTLQHPDWITKPSEDVPENRLAAEEVDDNFLALWEHIEALRLRVEQLEGG